MAKVIDRLGQIGSGGGGGGGGRGRRGGVRNKDGIPKDDSKLKCVRCDEMGHRKADCTKKFAELSRLDWRVPLFEPPQHWYRQSCAGLSVQQDGVQAAGVETISLTCSQPSADQIWQQP